MKYGPQEVKVKKENARIPGIRLRKTDKTKPLSVLTALSLLSPTSPRFCCRYR